MKQDRETLYALVDIKVVPKSSRRAIVVDENGNIRVCLNSPPVDGRANDECIALFSKKLGIAKSSISIRKGAKGRNKTLLITGMDENSLIEKLNS
ncbi:MAG TPA: DUF167 domain-containing protein [Spirochaetota bacterium]|nr:DUF167 domain-containing protein [Spirochaetota bacterium]HPI89763.1 DUF167 domain-containing protein [Spirochaetota bacterium]HPR47592.1 DUF167 domain-containing protein [Spirochaetota bacterium]